MSQVDKKDEVDHVEDGRYTLEARAEDGAPKTRDLAAITFINDRERNLSTWEGIKRYRVALFYAFFLSLGALLSGLDGSVSKMTSTAYTTMLHYALGAVRLTDAS
jgi:hypothetical protein